VNPNDPAHTRVSHLNADPSTQIISCSDLLLQEGIDFYAKRPDKAWSLTDCISFVVMQKEGASARS
jgi:predicted nucleic acid-binding protein